MRFKDKAVIITGGAKGIGAGCARVFSREGGLVVVADKDRAGGEAMAAELNATGPGKAIFVEVDVRDQASLEKLVAETISQFGRLDCLVNNAGWHPPAQDILEVSLEDFEGLVRLNLSSVFMSSKAALPHLLQTRGTIVNLASMVGLIGQAKAIAYCATKAGVIGLTKALAIDYAPKGVRVNAVCPAGVDTPLMHEWAATLDDPAAGLRSQAEMHKLGRMATPEEIGRVCLFLATEDSAFVTGQAIQVEGGATLDYR